MRATGGVWFEPGIHLGVEAEFRPARKAHPGLRMADLDATAARLEAAGIGPGVPVAAVHLCAVQLRRCDGRDFAAMGHAGRATGRMSRPARREC
jgi:hypothetical protein